VPSLIHLFINAILWLSSVVHAAKGFNELNPLSDQIPGTYPS
jgi:hypothetical protein